MEKRNDIVDVRLRASLLYDYYGSLLNENQRELCSRYLLDDLSLSEIADHAGISRQGVHDKIKRSVKQMEAYEDKIGLIKLGETIEASLFEMKRALEKSEEPTLKKVIGEKIDFLLDLL